ncbi:hypothetical protein KP509_03G084800 [Ceratopteris richardii]|uniref:RING-type domain-containing protein n=1 Tax=Ceratopteris richardii TaxID=49495 RepID=A0A8T2V4M2_CERRI|nr:hypothetical protein KP509_03G084800 [Ceratopteris richardii]
MAVEADNSPGSLFGLFKNRAVEQIIAMDLCASSDPPKGDGSGNGTCFLPLYQNFDPYQSVASRVCSSAAAPQHQCPAVGAFPATRQRPSRKRNGSALEDPHPPSQHQTFLKPAAVHHSAFNLLDLNRRQGSSSPPQTVKANPNQFVSTGLRLASFDDDGSTVTSSKPDPGSTSTLGDEISAQLANQQHELQQIFVNHAEQLQYALSERTRYHSQALLANIEEQVSRRVCDRDMELARVKRHNSDLEERIKQLSLETHMWQSKAKSYEAMVAVLRSNLQQAIMYQSRDLSKLEGCGDSDADDAASAHIDENAQTQRTLAMMSSRKADAGRACKRCNGKEVTILLLPCMHLCLCQDCKLDVEKCPVCSTQRSAFIEVYLA